MFGSFSSFILLSFVEVAASGVCGSGVGNGGRLESALTLLVEVAGLKNEKKIN